MYACFFQGFLRILGKFEGDPYERLYLRIGPNPLSHSTSISTSLSTSNNNSSNSSNSNMLFVRIESGEEIMFDLSVQSFVCEDPRETSVLVLDHKKTIVAFKVSEQKIQIFAWSCHVCVWRVSLYFSCFSFSFFLSIVFLFTLLKFIYFFLNVCNSICCVEFLEEYFHCVFFLFTFSSFFLTALNNPFTFFKIVILLLLLLFLLLLLLGHLINCCVWLFCCCVNCSCVCIYY